MKRFTTAVLGFAIISFHCSDSEAGTHSYEIIGKGVPSTLQQMPYCLGFNLAFQVLAGRAPLSDYEWIQSEAQLAQNVRRFETTLENVRELQRQGFFWGKKCWDYEWESCHAKVMACRKIKIN